MSTDKDEENSSSEAEAEIGGSFEGYELPSIHLSHKPKDPRTKAKYNIFSRLYFL